MSRASIHGDATVHPRDGEAGEQVEVYTVESGGRRDENNVDVNKEIGRLTKNELLYQTYTQILASQFAMTRSAITGR